MIDMPIGRVAAAYAANRSPAVTGLAPGGLVPNGLAETKATAFGASGVFGADAVAATSETDFGAFLDKQIAQAVDTLKESERVSMSAVAGKASAQEVVRSVLAAEMTVQSVVAIRDKMVQAYQEIMRISV
ncbi:flagellar hook-basal body complex protein FliE [Azospirillum agricola]|uniref:flagellar hook-basal body complex protein FliE n=1 Tax=Azospirillum agricola TaxID=1720247 RepID=UPI001AE59530|nr:flagellar hook-basal body complex protein FliE [Azospirillum agricola]MBP2232384.1 flagellar hook-basal body complex protein FliE [Azospirillum agricola]